MPGRLRRVSEDFLPFRLPVLIWQCCAIFWPDGSLTRANSDHFFPLGAVLFTKGTYVETVKIIEETQTPYVNFSHGERFAFDWKNGGLSPIVVPDVIRQALIQEFQVYAQLWQTKFAPFSALGFKVSRFHRTGGSCGGFSLTCLQDGVPDELTVPMAQWLATNGFRYLGIPITDLLSTYGYGDYREVPAVSNSPNPSILRISRRLTAGQLYCMKFIAPDVLGSALGAVQPYMTGMSAPLASKTVDAN